MNAYRLARTAGLRGGCMLRRALASRHVMAARHEKLRVGKAVPEAFSFVPIDIGMRKGIFAQARPGARSRSRSRGDARMQQAAAADSIDILLGSGPAMAFIAKGAPIKAVAAMAGPPLLLAVVVRPDGPKTAADLKGKKISVSTAGSLTYWLVSETSRRQGWGADGIQIQPMGAMPGQIAALKRGDIDGVIMDIGNAFDLEKRGDGRILVRFGDIKDFHIHVIFATDKVIAGKPEAVRGFLEGLVRDHRLHARQQGRDRGDRHGGDQQERGHRQPQLRRADGDVLRHRQVRAQGAGDAAANPTSSCSSCRASRTCRSSTRKRSCRNERRRRRHPHQGRLAPVRRGGRNPSCARAAAHLARGRARRAALPDRAERLRQEHAAQHHRRTAAADHRHGGGRQDAGARAAAARDRLRVPGERAVSLVHGDRERQARHGVPGRAAGTSTRSAPARRWKRSGSRTSSPTIPPSFRAGCASARRSRARSACRPGSC